MILKSPKYLLISILLLCIVGFSCKPNPLSRNNENADQVKPYNGLVKLTFLDVESEKAIPFDILITAILIKFTRQPQDEGVEIKRWTGDTSGQYKYVEIERRELVLRDYIDGTMLLESGLYQIQHNSVSGQPPSGYYGDSDFFEINVDDRMKEIRIVLYPAI